MARLLNPATPTSDWTVVCLCADWCSTCRDYRPAFERRASERDDARYVWIDIEDDSDAIGDIDVETLPTLLVLEHDRPQFFGPVLPMIDIVDRTLRALKQHGPAGDPVPVEQRDAVAAVLRHLKRTM